MVSEYVIYSLRAQGWINRGGTAGTQLEDAKRFEEAEAIEYAKRGRSHDNGLILIPVEVRVLRELGQIA